MLRIASALFACCLVGCVNDVMSLDGGAPDGGGVEDAGAAVDAGPPQASGCITDVGTGDHAFTCDGLAVDVRIPAACQAPGCGLVLELHGDTGNGLLMDGHTQLRALGAARGYIVVAPTGPPFGGGYPGSTWHDTNDAALVSIVGRFRDVFRVDPKKIHVTGFSRGGFSTWRLLCDHSDLFASAAPAGAGFGGSFGEDTCFDGDVPARRIPILFLVGRTDASVGYSTMTSMRDAIVDEYGASGPVLVDSGNDYLHQRWTSDGGVALEVFDHEYETVDDGPWASAQGHCIPGSTADPYGAQYAIPCVLPNAFVWGEEVMDFFVAHPAR